MGEKNYTVLARKWRPQLFDEVVGQEHITRTLRNAIASGRIHHAFLFIGSRGIGKTTTARILAKALNCAKFDAPTVEPCGECDNCTSIGAGSNIDVIEIDGASNNGIDDIREIRDNIRMVPTSGRYKVYIIDEVHQLSIQAFNGLLKTLEEPPPHAVFILATTEAHKIPATIISRCQRYDFRRVAMADIVGLLRRIIEKEGLKATDEALYAVARAAEGGVRDSESILDQVITYCDGEITFQDVFDVLGLVDWRSMHRLCDAIVEADIPAQLQLVEEVVSAGKDLTQFVEEILRYYRNLLVCKTSKDPELLRLPPEEVAEMEARAGRFTLVKLIRLVEQFAELTKGFDSQLAQRTALEALLIRLSKVDVEVSLDTVMEKLLMLGAGGIAPSARPSPPANPSDAGPAKSAPSVPASPRRVAVTGDAPGDAWPLILEHARALHPALGALFGEAVPETAGDGVLVLRFREDDLKSQAAAERPDIQKAFGRVLAETTENLTGYRLAGRAAAEEAAAPEKKAEAPRQRTISPEEQKQLVMSNPGLFAVMQVFPGRVVRVGAETEGDEERAARAGSAPEGQPGENEPEFDEDAAPMD